MWLLDDAISTVTIVKHLDQIFPGDVVSVWS